MRYLTLIVLLAGCAGSTMDNEERGCIPLVNGDTVTIADCYHFTTGPEDRHYVSFITEAPFTVSDSSGDLFSYPGGPMSDPLLADIPRGTYTVTLHESIEFIILWTPIP